MVFIIWPLLKLPFLRRSETHHTTHDVSQIEIYDQQLDDLEKARGLGDIDEVQFEELKLELQKTLITDGPAEGSAPKLQAGGKKFIIGMAVILPLLSFVTYSQWGAKPDWEIYQFLQKLPEAQSTEDHNNRMRSLVVKVQARLNQKPDNTQLQNLLAQSSMALQDYDLAVDAYRRILEQFPNSPRIMSNLAQAMFYRAGNTVTPEVREYTQKTLQLAPMMPEMLGLAGIDAKNTGDYAGAIRYWEAAVSQMDANSRTAQGYRNGISRAEQALAASKESGDAEPAPSDAAASGDGVSVRVSLADGVQVNASDTVFIYARAWEGPAMPLAIERLSVSDLPSEVVLDKSMAMTPNMDITSFPELEIVARISLSGSASLQAGDWQVTAGPIKLTELEGAVDLVISKQVR